MYRSVYILFLAVAACSGSPRIVGGGDADIRDFPYTALIWNYDRIICGATIISTEWVITDAFCTYDPDVTEYSILVGSSFGYSVESTGSFHNLTQWIDHPDGDVVNREYDFSLIKITPPFVFNEYVAAATLPAQDESTPENATGIIAGWGQTAQGGFFGPVDRLQYANVTLVSDDDCYTNLGGGYNGRTLCAKGTDHGVAICWHDEGAPLVVDRTLYGVSMWPGGNCADPRQIQLFSRVAAVRDWIDETMAAQ